jgi:hypothetical protein
MPHEVGVGWTVTHFQLNLGLALHKTRGHLDEAMKEYQEAPSIHPGVTPVLKAEVNCSLWVALPLTLIVW